jgi:hypothetical protein
MEERSNEGVENGEEIWRLMGFDETADDADKCRYAKDFRDKRTSNKAHEMTAI